MGVFAAFAWQLRALISLLLLQVVHVFRTPAMDTNICKKFASYHPMYEEYFTLCQLMRGYANVLLGPDLPTFRHVPDCPAGRCLNGRESGVGSQDRVESGYCPLESG